MNGLTAEDNDRAGWDFNDAAGIADKGAVITDHVVGADFFDVRHDGRAACARGADVAAILVPAKAHAHFRAFHYELIEKKLHVGAKGRLGDLGHQLAEDPVAADGRFMLVHGQEKASALVRDTVDFDALFGHLYVADLNQSIAFCLQGSQLRRWDDARENEKTIVSEPPMMVSGDHAG